jgi:hypothetical protein
VVAAVGEERFPDPEKFALGLLIERLLRVNPGMDEKPMTVVVAQRQRAQPFDMIARQIARASDVVAAQCLLAALLQPKGWPRRAAPSTASSASAS